MEARMQPRSDGTQRCLQFGLSTTPRVARDDVPGSRRQHRASLQHSRPPRRGSRSRPRRWSSARRLRRSRSRCGVDAWAAARCADRRLASTGRSCNPSPFAQTDAAARRARARAWTSTAATIRCRCCAASAPTSTTRFEYSPKSTRVDSPIDDALRGAAGRVPGLRAHHDRAGPAARHPVPLRQRLSVPSTPTARSIARRRDARVGRGAVCRTLGWVGFDPTNNLIAGERHIRVAVGRDYADVPPTRGVFKGKSAVAASWRSRCASALPARARPWSPTKCRRTCPGCRAKSLHRCRGPIRHSRSSSRTTRYRHNIAKPRRSRSVLIFTVPTASRCSRWAR